MEFIHGPTSQVTNTDLAAALGTLGIPRDAEQPLQVLQGDVERVAFFFGEHSECGTYHTGPMVDCWNSPDLHRSHPRHAITYMRCALHTRHRLLDYAHGRSRIALALRTGGQFEAIHAPAAPISSPPRTPRQHPMPDPVTTPRLQTEDIELAAALLACGIPLWRDIPIERHAGRLTFFFHPSSPCGAFATGPLMLAWQDRQWHISNPEHPFSYISCAIENRRRLMREIHRKVPLVVFIRAGFPQFLTLNADTRTEKLFMDEMKQL
jgi:hypothetical protein